MNDRSLHLRVADEFCSHGYCGGDTSSAPCEEARRLADIALTAIAKAGLVVIPATQVGRNQREKTP
jgi:hypothetical protein